MKKRLICFLIAVICIIPMAFTGCKDDDDVIDTGKRPITLNLYGITNTSTTEEAILKVQDEMNKYTEGKFNTHIVLHLYPEAEYYSVIDKKMAEIEKIKAEKEAEEKRRKEQEKADRLAGITRKESETTVPETEAETYEENGVKKVVYPEEKDTQLDIFMVQGASNLNRYYKDKHLSPLSDALANTSKKLFKYIGAELFSCAMLEGKGNAAGTVDKGTVYGIPNNYVCGEDTYLLVNKEIAEKYYYSADNVSTLPKLENFLDDAAKDYKDYITLYNEPTFQIAYATGVPSLIGGVVSNKTNGLTRMVPRDIMGIPGYRTFREELYNFRKAGYITDGDYYKFPVDADGKPAKVAAAFLKGDASLPEKYEKDYFVIKYALPFATAEERPGTMFCVSSFTSNVDRCMEIITALQTVPNFRNTFQYGVKEVNYTVDEYTGIIKYLNDEYSMDPKNTGNLFILTPNSNMSEAMLKLSENDWKLGKQQQLETITSPYSMFNLRIITKDNYKTESYSYAVRYEAALKKAKEEQGKDFDESKFVFDEPYGQTYTDEIFAELVKLSKEYMDKIDAFEEYTDEEGEVVTIKDYIKSLRAEFEENKYYKMLIDEEDIDSVYVQYNNWYTKNGPVM